MIAPGGTQLVEWGDDGVYLTGSAEVLCAGEWLRHPASNSFGDIERVFLVTSGSFSIRADVKASDAFFGVGYACLAVYDPTHTPASGSSGPVLALIRRLPLDEDA